MGCFGWKTDKFLILYQILLPPDMEPDAAFQHEQYGFSRGTVLWEDRIGVQTDTQQFHGFIPEEFQYLEPLEGL